MTGLPYVLVVLFALGDGSVLPMSTTQQFRSPLSCSMKAFLENENARGRTYICVTLDHAAALVANQSRDAVLVVRKPPLPQTTQGHLN